MNGAVYFLETFSLVHTKLKSCNPSSNFPRVMNVLVIQLVICLLNRHLLVEYSIQNHNPIQHKPNDLKCYYYTRQGHLHLQVVFASQNLIMQGPSALKDIHLNPKYFHYSRPTGRG